MCADPHPATAARRLHVRAAVCSTDPPATPGVTWDYCEDMNAGGPCSGGCNDGFDGAPQVLCTYAGTWVQGPRDVPCSRGEQGPSSWR